MKRNLFEKFQEKTILAETSKNVIGGTSTVPHHDYSAETGDNECTGGTAARPADCGDNVGSTDFFNDVSQTSANSDNCDERELGFSRF